MAEDTLPLVKAGRRMGESTETAFRGAMFNRALQEGMTPQAAMDLVHKYHFNYGALTDFEKNVMRRAMPFYSFHPIQSTAPIWTSGITAGNDC